TLPPELLEAAERHEFDLWLQLPVRFPVECSFTSPDSSSVKTIRELITHYTAERMPDAVGLFEYGQTNKSAFWDTALQASGQLHESLDAPVYFKSWQLQEPGRASEIDFWVYRLQTDRNNPSFSELDEAGTNYFLFEPAREIRHLDTPLKNLLERSESNPDITLFFHSGWLLEALEEQPGLEGIFQDYTGGSEIVFPTSEEQAEEEAMNVINILLIILWASFIWHYRSVPLYRKSLFRYFYSHKFFISDVTDRHLRLFPSAATLFVQHAFAGGILVTVAYSYLLSDLGSEAFLHHFPLFDGIANAPLPLFGTAFAFFFLFQLLCVIWLMLVRPSSNRLDRTLPLYAWPFHLNIVFITVLVTLYTSTDNSTSFIVFGGFFLFTFLISFLLGAIDLGKSLRKKRILYHLGSSGIYILLLTALVAYIIYDPCLLDILELTAQLP
ncbi:MAG: hypothetical protein ACOC4S_02470, partial [Balneolaceae bacterium]